MNIYIFYILHWFYTRIHAYDYLMIVCMSMNCSDLWGRDQWPHEVCLDGLLCCFSAERSLKVRMVRQTETECSETEQNSCFGPIPMIFPPFVSISIGSSSFFSSIPPFDSPSSDDIGTGSWILTSMMPSGPRAFT